MTAVAAGGSRISAITAGPTVAARGGDRLAVGAVRACRRTGAAVATDAAGAGVTALTAVAAVAGIAVVADDTVAGGPAGPPVTAGPSGATRPAGAGAAGPDGRPALVPSPFARRVLAEAGQRRTATAPTEGRP